MKRIIALLLALAMIFALAACGNDKPNNETPKESVNTQPSDATVTPPSEITPNDTTEPSTPKDPVEDDQPQESWAIKEDVKVPTFQQPQKITEEAFDYLKGQKHTVQLYKSFYSDINPDELLTQLKALPLFEGWTWEKEIGETSDAKIYADSRMPHGYTYSVILRAEKELEDYSSHDISIHFVNNTIAYQGWNLISVRYYTGDKEIGSEQQQTIFPVLQMVYGDSAEYLLYAPITDTRYNKMKQEIDNDLGSETLSRTMEEHVVSFCIDATNKADRPFKYYSSIDYAPFLTEIGPQYLNAVFKNFDNMNFGDVYGINSKFFSRWVKEYDFTSSSLMDDLYEYRVTEYENGDKDVKFSAELRIYNKGDVFVDGQPFECSYAVEVRDGVVSIKSAELHMRTSTQDVDKAYAKNNIAYAQKVANAVLGTNYSFDDVYWNNSSDCHLEQLYKLQINEKEISATFIFGLDGRFSIYLS